MYEINCIINELSKNLLLFPFYFIASSILFIIYYENVTINLYYQNALNKEKTPFRFFQRFIVEQLN